jgi:putative addiction module component (TIGR02574 family)
MSTQAEQVLGDAMKLTEADRADLAARLLESLDPEVDQGVEEAWRVEIERRLDALEKGQVKAVPWAEARRHIAGGGENGG